MTDQEAMRIGEGDLPHKPLAVWLAQGMCAIVALSCIWFSTKLETQSAALTLLGLGVLHIVILLGVGRRRRWARWLAVCFFGMAGLSSLGQALSSLATASGEPALYLSSTVTLVLCTIVTVHFVLGEPVKAFFGVQPLPTPRPRSRQPRSDDPYAEPSE